MSLYLKDLNLEMQGKILEWFVSERRFDLVEAFYAGLDIKIGLYFSDVKSCE